MTNPRLDLATNISDLAGWYFDTQIRPLHIGSGVPPDGVSYMRKHYIQGVHDSPEAQKQLKIAFKRALMSGSMVE